MRIAVVLTTLANHASMFNRFCRKPTTTTTKCGESILSMRFVIISLNYANEFIRQRGRLILLISVITHCHIDVTD